MSTFSVHFDTDNDAFDAFDDGGTSAPLEIARILQDVAAKVCDGRETGGILDVNGNIVGQFDWLKP